MKEKGSSAFDDVVDEKSKKNPETKSKKRTKGESTQSTEQDGGGKGNSESVSDSEPVFPYADVEQHSVYMRGETWEALEDVKYYAEGKLREEFNVRNVETREFDEAIAQLMVNEIGAEKLAERVVKLRGFGKLSDSREDAAGEI